jgi:hypothetical protein
MGVLTAGKWHFRWPHCRPFLRFRRNGLFWWVVRIRLCPPVVDHTNENFKVRYSAQPSVALLPTVCELQAEPAKLLGCAAEVAAPLVEGA